MHRVVVLAISEVIGYDLNIPPQAFSSAKRDGQPLYDVRICGVDDEPVRVTPGYTAHFSHGPEALAEADTVVIPGTRVEGPRRIGTLPEKIAEALAMIPAGARIMSICTGAFVLAAAGLLDGRRATTHWAHAAEFRRLYPRVELDENVLFVDNGDLLTAAGLSAGMDLCLHVIRSDHGSAVANTAARYCVVPPWRDGGQSQFIDHPTPDSAVGSTAATRAWALERLGEPLDLDTLARHARMSVRTFSRRFRAETGLSARAWLNQQRVLRARQLLETTNLAVDRVAAEAGLGTAASLRQHLNAAIGVSPLAYRRTFSRP
ncbi:GlxA family transcriptional regulator [Amycolatopsis sp.]|uniref:GlxA family transcriptional regulator n=1 Tax=Amycolatopsis sp. TaxID=37632 RepID=UPI002C97B099|nr:helix-turn-helix domain-containing protein [Amycolatopsis sp.]HVV10822.1 helix-turn-helix domain-containing protein [Amycolatopsis sp.]